jgi:N-acyl-L-homoserine lactone synthetase
MSDDLVLNPVAGWDVRTVESMQLVLLELGFISTPFQRPDEAQKSPIYALTLEQSRQLIDVLQRSVQAVESAGISSPPGPRH